MNTIGDVCPNLFPERFQYRTYYLQDTRQQNVLPVLYDCIAFIHFTLSEGSDNASRATGKRRRPRVLIHCKEGVSRSATLAVAFLMWRLRLSFAEALELVNAFRLKGGASLH